MFISELTVMIAKLQKAWKIVSVVHSDKVGGTDQPLTTGQKAAMRAEWQELRVRIKELAVKFDKEDIVKD